MKRGGRLKRTKPLARATAALSRSKPLARGNTRLKRSGREKAIVGLSTMAAVRRRQGGVCACGCGGRIAPAPIGFHHVLPKAKWPALVDVAANIVGVTADCHANHETAARRLSLEAVAVVFGLELDGRQRAYLEGTYAGGGFSSDRRSARLAERLE